MTKNQFFTLYQAEKERLSVYTGMQISCSYNEEKGYRTLFYTIPSENVKYAVCLTDTGNLNHFLKSQDNEKLKPYLQYELMHFKDKPYLLSNPLNGSCVPYFWEKESVMNYSFARRGEIDLLGYWINNYIDEHSWNENNGHRAYTNWLYVEYSDYGYANTPKLIIDDYVPDPYQKEHYNPYKLYEYDYYMKCKNIEETRNIKNETIEEIEPEK